MITEYKEVARELLKLFRNGKRWITRTRVRPHPEGGHSYCLLGGLDHLEANGKITIETYKGFERKIAEVRGVPYLSDCTTWGFNDSSTKYDHVKDVLKKIGECPEDEGKSQVEESQETKNE